MPLRPHHPKARTSPERVPPPGVMGGRVSRKRHRTKDDEKGCWPDLRTRPKHPVTDSNPSISVGHCLRPWHLVAFCRTRRYFGRSPSLLEAPAGTHCRSTSFAMKIQFRPYPLISLLALLRADGHWIHADTVASATLNFSLNGDAFAHGADVAYIETFGITYDPSQNFMEFAGHNSSNLPGRPLPSPANFDTVRAGWVRPDSSDLRYDFNPSPSLQTLAFDPSSVATAGATGSTRFLGGTSFWYANQSLMYQGDSSSIWIQFGEVGLSYDSTRAVGGNSGWVIANHILGDLPLFDIRNASVTAVAASGGSPGGLDIKGDLFTAQEFRDGFAIQSGLNVGTIAFRATTVPEPSAVLMLGIGGLGAAFLRCRRRNPVI